MSLSLNSLFLLQQLLLGQTLDLRASDEEIAAVLATRRELIEAITDHPDSTAPVYEDESDA